MTQRARYPALLYSFTVMFCFYVGCRPTLLMRILITRTATAAAVAAGEKQRERPICFLASGAVRPFVWLCLTRQICSACFSSSLAVAVAVAPIAASAAPLPYAHRHASIYELSQVADFVDLHSPFLYANFGRGVRVVGRGGGEGARRCRENRSRGLLYGGVGGVSLLACHSRVRRLFSCPLAGSLLYTSLPGDVVFIACSDGRNSPL